MHKNSLMTKSAFEVNINYVLFPVGAVINHVTNYFSPDMNFGYHAVHVKIAPIVMHFVKNSVFCFGIGVL